MRPIVPVRGLLLAALALATVLSTSAAARAGDAEITVTQAHPLESSTHYFVSLTGPDGEPVAGSSMTATPIGPDGAERAAVTMEESSGGEFQGAVPMPEPGTWRVRFTTTDPATSTEATQVVGGAAPTQAPTSAAVPATPVPAPTTEGTTPGTTAEPEDTEVATDAASTTDDSDDGLGTVLLVVGGLMVLAAVVGTVIALTRKPKPSGPDAPEDEAQA